MYICIMCCCIYKMILHIVYRILNQFSWPGTWSPLFHLVYLLMCLIVLHYRPMDSLNKLLLQGIYY